MSLERRQKLKADQLKLLEALTQGTQLDGFDDERLGVCAASLRQKRLRTILRMHPCLSDIETIDETFEQYAKENTYPTSGPQTDATLFIQHLNKRNLSSRTELSQLQKIRQTIGLVMHRLLHYCHAEHRH